jgi:TatD DNase family protein
MIDLHCHLDLYPDPRAIVAECVRRRLYALSVTTVPSAFEGTAALAPAEGRIRTALGLHPELAAARARELPLFERLLPKTPYVGEVGLDSSRDHRATLDVQRGVLRDVLRLCARAGGKILSLHSRGATGLILDALSSELGAGTPILHWYIGTPKQVARASDIGCWFSVGPAMLASERGRAAVLAMPRESVLPESDGPFGRVEDQPLRPWEAWSIAGALSQIWREDEVGVVYQLRSNFAALVKNGLAAASADSMLRNSSYS